jgi:hypothetical protein
LTRVGAKMLEIQSAQQLYIIVFHRAASTIWAEIGLSRR